MKIDLKGPSVYGDSFEFLKVSKRNAIGRADNKLLKNN